MQTQIERLTADNAALREALGNLREASLGGATARGFWGSVDAATHAFTQPDPGAKLLEELAALRKVADAAMRWRGQALLTSGRWSPTEYALIDALEKYEDFSADEHFNTQEAPNAPTK